MATKIKDGAAIADISEIDLPDTTVSARQVFGIDINV